MLSACNVFDKNKQWVNYFFITNQDNEDIVFSARLQQQKSDQNFAHN